MFKSVIGYFIVATLFCACSGQNEPISPVSVAGKSANGAKVIPVVQAPQRGNLITPTESQVQGTWHLTYCDYGTWNYNNWNFGHRFCELYYVYMTLSSTGPGVGTVSRANGLNCGYTFSDVVSGGIYYTITPDQSGETATYDMNTIYAPLFFRRQVGSTLATDGYTMQMSDDLQTLYLTGSGRSAVYHR